MPEFGEPVKLLDLFHLGGLQLAGALIDLDFQQIALTFECPFGTFGSCDSHFHLSIKQPANQCQDAKNSREADSVGWAGGLVYPGHVRCPVVVSFAVNVYTDN